jgi:hypothetical protein
MDLNNLRTPLLIVFGVLAIVIAAIVIPELAGVMTDSVDWFKRQFN